MANISFTVRNPETVSNAIITKSALSSSMPLTYSLNTGSKWIYCNHPERLTDDCLGDNGYCLNQVKINEAGTNQIFYSYSTQKLDSSIKFGIQIFNPNKYSVTFNKLYAGHSDSEESGGWSNCIYNAWRRYFNTSSTSTAIATNGSFWCVDEQVSAGKIFTGTLRFSVTGPVIVTIYAYRNKSKIDGYATPYFYDGSLGKQYSGYGYGYFYMSTVTLKASELQNGAKGFKTNYPSGLNIKVNSESKTSDLIPIHLANPSSTTINADGNLGNWGTQYGFTLKLYNDTDKDITFRGYIRTDTNNTDDWAIVAVGGKVHGAKLNTAGDGNTWHWFEQTVKAGATDVGSYQWILGTNSCHKFSHIFDVK